VEKVKAKSAPQLTKESRGKKTRINIGKGEGGKVSRCAEIYGHLWLEGGV